jgi:glutamate synthase (NADPH/NADH) small chain
VRVQRLASDAGGPHYLQRFAVETTLTNGQASGLLHAAPANGKKVACVGAGPASLAAAGYLALEGVQVTLLERRRLSGGLNSTGVAPYKMHTEASLLEVDYIKSLGVTVREGVEVGKDVDVEQLLKDHDAIFMGPGLGGDATLGIPGEDGPGVIGATAWIERLKLDPKFELDGTRRALVIGGGNTSIDAARELAQLGVAEVSLVYRRTAAEMPGYRHELEAALREGVRFVERAVPRAFVHDGAKLAALELQDGRKLQADLVIVGIGQSKLRDLLARFPGVAVDDRGRAVVDAATGRTGNPKIFAGGDVLGGELVVTAVQEAKRAARAICRQLGVAVRTDSPMMAGHE